MYTCYLLLVERGKDVSADGFGCEGGTGCTTLLLEAVIFALVAEEVVEMEGMMIGDGNLKDGTPPCAVRANVAAAPVSAPIVTKFTFSRLPAVSMLGEVEVAVREGLFLCIRATGCSLLLTTAILNCSSFRSFCSKLCNSFCCALAAILAVLAAAVRPPAPA